MRNSEKQSQNPSMDTREAADWRRQQDGSYRGMGPRTYKRRDERILEEINDRLCDNPYLDASEMEVGINEGEVLLTGSVENREDKRLAEEIAENVTGVRNVENRLRVKLRGI